MDKKILLRAQGCLMGQVAGDSLGSLVEFCPPREIRQKYPRGVRHLEKGGIWGTLAGQPTDDSELALLLARSLVRHGEYIPADVLESYQYWLRTGPFDCGNTIRAALTGKPTLESQANGALMRISPLGIFCTFCGSEQLTLWAAAEAALTHSHPVCRQINILYTRAIAAAIKEGPDPKTLYNSIQEWAHDMGAESAIIETILQAQSAPPEDYLTKQGWVLTAFGNALWQLLQAPSFEEGVVDTVMQGGDTDTNAAICGALLGAVYGLEAVPAQWVQAVLQCRPAADNPDVPNPRPEVFWPQDILDLARQLIEKSLRYL